MKRIAVKRAVVVGAILAYLLIGYQAASTRIYSASASRFPDQCHADVIALGTILWPIWWPISYAEYSGPIVPHMSKRQRWESFHEDFPNLSWKHFQRDEGYCLTDSDPHFVPDYEASR